MVELTVGYVSGFIALAIYVLQYFFPNAIALVIVGCLQDVDSAVTWSVTGRELQSTLWPVLLCADTSASRDVRWQVRLLQYVRLLAFLLVAISAVVTPLGLYNSIRPSDSFSTVRFGYAPDAGPMGYGTPTRTDTTFSRICSAGIIFGDGPTLPGQCPGTTVDIVYTDDNQTASILDNYDTRIPSSLASFYQSGLDGQPSTVSSIFDIQWRQYTYTHQRGVDHGNRYIVGTYRQLDNLILDDTIQPVEGLIVDTKQGGIGFRYHTVPTGLKYGAQWSEDILFVEPETVCVDTNLTIEFIIDDPFTSLPIRNLTLRDLGGFASLNTTFPVDYYLDAQHDPQLRNRAYGAAWLNNALSMFYLNVTQPGSNAFTYVDSEMGKGFPLSDDVFSAGNSVQKLTATSTYGGYLSLSPLGTNLNSGNQYPNPFQITSDNFTGPTGPFTQCAGATVVDLANISHIAMGCGLLYGAAKRTDGSNPLVFEPGSAWTQPLYSCASATIAKVKTVYFTYKSSQPISLKSLSIDRIEEKGYGNTSSLPIWAVERSNLSLGGVSPLWGLVSDKNQDFPLANYSTSRAGQLYLPGYVFADASGPSEEPENLPGADFHTAAMGGAFAGGDNDIFDNNYSGANSLALFVKWQELSRNASSAANIVNLIWTDIAANAVFGTRGWLSTSKLPSNLQKRETGPIQGSQEKTFAEVAVKELQNSILYHLPFAIPALLTLLLFALVFVAMLFSAIFRGARPKRMLFLLNHLSAGRLLASRFHPDMSPEDLSSARKWIDKVGKEKVDLKDMMLDQGAQIVNGHQSSEQDTSNKLQY